MKNAAIPFFYNRLTGLLDQLGIEWGVPIPMRPTPYAMCLNATGFLTWNIVR